MRHKITLNGMTWNHTRGFLPMVATAQRFGEMHPDIEIVWRKRTLQEFADYPIEKLAEEFDLIVIDHPFVGYAAQNPGLLPLDNFLPADFLNEQAAQSTGASHASYNYDGHQWALAIDAATPVSTFRPDLLEQRHLTLPATWEELLEFAERGVVVVAAIPIDCLMNFFMLCCAHGEEPFSSPDKAVSEDVGAAALRSLRDLVRRCPEECLERNPIQTYEAMAGRDEIVYCPFAYSYSNYSRPAYTDHPMQAGGLVTFNGQRLRSTLGGTGLAISQFCAHTEAACDYAQFVASGECQRGLYFASGGQPGHRSAWTDTTVNALSNDFFAATLQTVEEAYMRPRYPGYLLFQDEGGVLVQKFILDTADEKTTLRDMELLRIRSMV
jgi:multiple sugar transport system substrate-binding protein